MFKFASVSRDFAAPRRPAASLLASILIHISALAAVVFMNFPQPIATEPLRPRSLTWLAPIPRKTLPAPRTSVVRRNAVSRLATTEASSLKLFRAPALPRQTAHSEPITLPSITIQQLPPRLTQDLEHLGREPAPPLRTDNLVTASLAPAIPLLQPALSAPVTRSSGFTDVVSESAPTRRAMRTSGFETAGAYAPKQPAVVPRGQAGFGESSFVPPPAADPYRAAALTSSPASDTRPVEILSKPRPAYTDEARRLRIEGEVLLEMSFTASGEARVLRTLRGLGLGLDECAVAAAQAIRFRPAEHAGTPADSAAVVHILFQLAY